MYNGLGKNTFRFYRTVAFNNLCKLENNSSGSNKLKRYWSRRISERAKMLTNKITFSFIDSLDELKLSTCSYHFPSLIYSMYCSSSNSELNEKRFSSKVVKHHFH